MRAEVVVPIASAMLSFVVGPMILLLLGWMRDRSDRREEREERENGVVKVISDVVEARLAPLVREHEAMRRRLERVEDLLLAQAFGQAKTDESRTDRQRD